MDATANDVPTDKMAVRGFPTLFFVTADGELRHVEHYFEGLESAVDALNALFTGANTGKVIIRVADPL